MAHSKLFTKLSNAAQAKVNAATEALTAKVTNLKNAALHIGQKIKGAGTTVVNGVEGGIAESYNIMADILALPLNSTDEFNALKANLDALVSGVSSAMSVAPLNATIQGELDAIVNNYNLDQAEAVAIYQAKVAAETAEDEQALANAQVLADALAVKIAETDATLNAISEGIRQGALADAAEIKMKITEAITPIYDVAQKNSNIVFGKSSSGQFYAGNVGVDNSAKKQALQDMANKYNQGEIEWE